jgi:hypothetical protein
MAKKILKYTIFVASPNDVEEEKQAVSEVVQELNLGYGTQNNIVFEVVKWETHSAPGISMIDTQQIINQDIGDDYDLFIGILWKKFGTETKTAGSGTEEEFLRAYHRFLSKAENFQILFYFKTASPNSLKDISWIELQKIEAFKKSLKDKNVLFWEFDNQENLKSFLRVHIPRRIESISRADDKIVQTVNLSKENSDIEEELGYIDFAEIIENSSNVAFNSLEQITKDTVWIGERLNEKTDELARITKSSNHNPIVVKEIFKRTALLMEDYSSRINLETPIFYSNFEDVIKASSNLINLTEDFYNEKTIDELDSTKETIFQFICGINDAIIGTTEFNNGVRNFPRIQKEINMAKKNLSGNLENLIEKLLQSKSLAETYKDEITHKIDKLKLMKNN